jgi:tetratricopeptide (TPR) repeat protein
MGTVYRAHDHQSGQDVALKIVFSAHNQERFHQEILVLTRMEHPNIVRYVGDGVLNGARYLVMEWLDGEDLGERLTRGPLGISASLALAEKLSETLGWLHAQGIVHRDLKPGNIFLTGPDGLEPRLIDFGIARVLGAARAEAAKTKAGAILGTPGYLAPEQARGVHAVDPRADVFALGAILFECLTGKPPFVAEGFVALLAKILLEEAPRPSQLMPSISPALDALVSEMLEKLPERRLSDGYAVLARLRALPREEAPLPVVAEAPALAARERRLLCLLLLQVRDTELDESDDDARTIIRDMPDELPLLEQLSQIASEFGGQPQPLADGSFVVTLVGAEAEDLALLGCRCALAARRTVPGASLSVSLGRGEVSALGLGGLIDRAARLVHLRPGHITLDEVTASLAQHRFLLGGEGEGALLLDEPSAPNPHNARSPYVGRQDELTGLRKLIDTARTLRRAQVALVLGPPGQGKSRLAEELLRSTPAESVQVVRGFGDPVLRGASLGFITRLFSTACELRDADPLEERRQQLRASLSGSLPDAVVRERAVCFLGELVGIPYDRNLPAREAARRDPSLMDDHQRRAFFSWLGGLCRQRPVLFLLDDLHWADPASLRWLDLVLGWLRAEPLAVVGFARPELRERAPELWRERTSLSLSLRPLSDEESTQLALYALGSQADSALVGRIVEDAEGNPFYIEALARAARRSGGVPRSETVLAAVQSHLESLSPSSRRLLRAASLFGVRFPREALGALLPDLSPEALDEALDDLLTQDLIIPEPNTSFDWLLFRHALTQEAAYQMLTDEDRAAGHLQAGEWLAARPGREPTAALASHFERGGDATQAICYYRRAAEEASDARSSGDLVLAYRDRAVALGVEGEDLGVFLTLSASVYGGRGRHNDALQAVQDALPLLAPGEDFWYRALAQMSISANCLGQRSLLLWVARTLEDYGISSQARGRQFRAWAVTAGRLCESGLPEDGARLLNRLTEVIGSTLEHDPVVAARYYNAQANYAMLTGDLGLVMGYTRAAQRAHEEAGDSRLSVSALSDVGYAFLELGQYESAEENLRRALSLTENDPDCEHLIASILQNLGMVLGRLGFLREGIETSRESLRMLQRQGNRRLQGGSCIYLAILLREAGAVEEAAQCAEEAAILFSGHPMRAYAYAAYALAQLERGDINAALPAAEEAFTISSQEPLESGESFVHLAYVEALAAVGDSRAGDAAHFASQRLHERAAKLSDLAFRESFLHRVPENAALLRWAAEFAP